MDACVVSESVSNKAIDPSPKPLHDPSKLYDQKLEHSKLVVQRCTHHVMSG
jgi:hypothetical protein